MKKQRIYRLMLYILVILFILGVMVYFQLNYSTQPRAEIVFLVILFPLALISFFVALFLKNNIRRIILVLSSLTMGLIILSFSLTHIIDEYQINNSFERAEKIILALEKYHDEKGKYPDSIEALVPKYLSQVPQPLTFDKRFDIEYDESHRDHILTFSSFRYIHYYSIERNMGWNVMGGY